MRAHIQRITMHKATYKLWKFTQQIATKPTDCHAHAACKATCQPDHARRLSVADPTKRMTLSFKQRIRSRHLHEDLGIWQLSKIPDRIFDGFLLRRDRRLSSSWRAGSTAFLTSLKCRKSFDSLTHAIFAVSSRFSVAINTAEMVNQRSSFKP